jgi:hypothetical protein
MRTGGCTGLCVGVWCWCASVETSVLTQLLLLTRALHVDLLLFLL